MRSRRDYDDCFICHPLKALLCDTTEVGYTMGALGALQAGHIVVGSSRHVSSISEMGVAEATKFCAYVEQWRIVVARQYRGNVGLFCHGGVPLCTDGKSPFYHLHISIIPYSRDPIEIAKSYIGEPDGKVSDLYSAMSLSGRESPKFVLSPDMSTFLLYSGRMIRQIGRIIFADLLERSELASWRAEPRLEESIANADSCKTIWSGAG